MTVRLEEEAESWTTPPGWGIYADLTPPELHNARRLKKLRRLLLGVLVAVVVLIVLAYGFARYQSHEAAAELATEQATTARLQAQQLRYGPVTQIQGSVAAVKAQLATLLVGDVSFAKLLASVSAATPKTVAITTEQVTIANTAVAAGAAAGTGSGTSLVTTGIPQIGQILVSGTAPDLRGFAAYVLSLQGVPNVAEVVPGSTGIAGGKVTFSVTLSVTNAVLSHHWDATPTATAAATSTAGTTPAVTPSAAGQ